MGTRSLISVYDDDDKPLLAVYRQFDGYPEGMGQDLYNFLKGRALTNGFGGDAQWRPVSNGMDDLAAQLLHHLKDNGRADHLAATGNVYLYPKPEGKLPEAEELKAMCDSCGGEYWYSIHAKDGGLEIAAFKNNRHPKLLYRGDPDGMAAALGLKDGDTVAERMEREAQDRAGGEWLVKNVSFRRLWEAAQAYFKTDMRESFMEFIENPANPVPELFEIQSQALNMDNLRWGDEPRLSRMTKAIEDYGRYIDPEKIDPRQWFERQTGVKTGEMGPKEKETGKSAPRA